VARLIEDANGKAAVLASIAAGVYAPEGRRHEGKTRKVLHAILSAADLPSSPGGRGEVKPEEALLGKWQNIGHKETVEFFKDGTVNFLSDGSPMEGDYKIVDDTHMRLHLGGFGGLAGPMVWKFAVSGDQLTLTLPDGKVAMYRRVQ
jgi:hypothetical protein